MIDELIVACKANNKLRSKKKILQYFCNLKLHQNNFWMLRKSNIKENKQSFISKKLKNMLYFLLFNKSMLIRCPKNFLLKLFYNPPHSKSTKPMIQKHIWNRKMHSHSKKNRKKMQYDFPITILYYTKCWPPKKNHIYVLSIFTVFFLLA